MKKNLILFLTIVFVTMMLNVLSVKAEQAKKPKKPYTEREFSTLTSDNQIIKSYLSYPKTKQKGYPTIIMLHSIGYNSSYWIPLQQKFNKKGFAVLRVDLRGHGKSVYSKTFHQRSWRSYKNDTFAKYPDDIIAIIKSIKKETKKANFNNYAIIGGDIGANTAVLVAKKLQVKPKALVLLSPSMTFKSLYIPVALTEIGTTPILALASKTDIYAIKEQEKLVKFAQGTFDVCNVEFGSGGMLLLKQHPEILDTILNWTIQYFKNQN